MAMSQARVLSNQLKWQPAFQAILRPYESCSIESMTYLMLRHFSSGKEGFRNRRTFNDNVDTRRQRDGENRNQNFQESDPNVNPRRETRSGRSSRSNCDSPPSFNSNRLSPPADPDVRRRNNDAPPLSDYAFLDKFKIAANKKETEPDGSRTAETELPVKDHQPINNKTDVQSPPQNADEIFRKMKETGLIPNAVAMLDGLCKDGLVQDAMKLFGLMREKGTIPEVVIYTGVVDGYCKAHQLDDAKRIFRKMQTNGIMPNAFTYGVLIQGLYKCNKLDDAVEITEEMLEAGHSPNVTTFVGLVDGICKEKGVEEAHIVVARLKQKGFFPNEKSLREFLEKRAPFSPSVWEAIFGKKTPQGQF